MTLQLEIEGIAPPSIATRKGRMKLSSLRPGDWIVHKHDEGLKTALCVLINSAKLQRLVVLHFGGREEFVLIYDHFSDFKYNHLGQGSRRRWHRFLPQFLRKRICEFNRPKP